MANVNIKEVEGGETTTVTSSHSIELDDGVNSTWASVVNLAVYVWNYLTSLTAKTTLVDADQLALADSAASNAGKKITWANVMAQAAAYTQTLTNKTLTTPTIASFANANHNHLTSAGGGVLITSSNISPTTANVTAAVNTRYFADISGLTANRNFVLPTPAIGDTIELSLTVGDDTYAFIIIGDTGIKINKGSAATEWSRLFITGESIRLVADATDNWQVMSDNRIASAAMIKNTAAQAIANNTSTVVTLDETHFDNASLAVTASDKILVRRTNKYIVMGYARLDGVSAAINRYNLWITDNSGNVLILAETYMASSTYPVIPISSISSLAAGADVKLNLYQNSGASQNTIGTASDYPRLSVVEVFT